MVYIRFSHNQVGMLIEASLDRNNWQTVELQKYTEFPTRAYGWGNVSHVMSTDRQETEYLKSLDRKNIKYEVIYGS